MSITHQIINSNYTNISNDILLEINNIISNKIGLYFRENDLEQLNKALISVLEKLNFKNAISCLNWLKNNNITKKEIEIFCSYLTVGETYFFRDQEYFSLLENIVIPEKINKNKNIKIWSIGCATGEEPYSIAIILSKLIKKLQFNFQIIASDINNKFINKAINGEYTEWSFRNTKDRIKKNYFVKENKKYKIIEEIRSMVNFFYLNLVEDTYPSILNNTNAVDIIFCKNVLMYFKENIRKKILEKIYKSLNENGLLIVSPVETPYVDEKMFIIEKHGKSIIYKKKNKFVNKSKSKKNIYDINEKRKSNSKDNITDNKIINIENIINDKTKNKIVLLNAVNLFKSGKYYDACEILNVFIKNNNNDIEAINLLAKLLANLGKLEDSLKWCKKSLSINNIDQESYYLCGTINKELGNIDQAIDCFYKILYLNKDSILANFSLGLIYKEQNNNIKSIKYFNNTLKILNKYKSEEVIDFTDGITAGKFIEIIKKFIIQYKEISNE